MERYVSNLTSLLTTRRQFLGLAAAVGATGLGLAALGGNDVLAQISPDVVRAYPSGGWLETVLPKRPDFINMDTGHMEYLRYICLHSPILKHTLRNSWNDIFSGREENPRLSNVFLKNIGFARQALQETMPKDNPSLENCVHIAVITMAAVISPYFTFGEIQDFGVNIQVPSDKKNKILKPLEIETEGPPDFIPSMKLPHVYPAELDQCSSHIDTVARCLGGDRAIHFTQHLFLTHQYLYALKYQLRDRVRIPFIVKPFLVLGSSNNRMKAIILDFLAGYFWEVKETYNDIREEDNPDVQVRGVPSGFRDSAINNDFAADGLGNWAAVNLYKEDNTDLTWEDIRRVLKRLDREQDKVVMRNVKDRNETEAQELPKSQTSKGHPIPSVRIASSATIYVN